MNGYLFFILPGLKNGLIFISAMSGVLFFIFIFFVGGEYGIDKSMWDKRLKIMLFLSAATAFTAFLIPNENILAKAANFNCGVLLKGL